jgi:TusA-related sulfurtransferase
MTKKELKKMNPGQTLELIVDDKGALKDVPALLNKTGDALLGTTESGDQLTFMIQKA